MNPAMNSDKNKEDKKIEYEEEEIKDLIYEEKLREQLKKNGYEVGEDVCEVKCVRAMEKVEKGKAEKADEELLEILKKRGLCKENTKRCDVGKVKFISAPESWIKK
jgi:hypothetical protein